MKTSAANIERVGVELLEKIDLSLVSCTSIQSLWAGYGQICRLQVVSKGEHSCQDGDELNIPPRSVILKFVSPPMREKSRKSQALDEGHLRKVLSYQVEQYFYTHLAPRMPQTIGIASCLASTKPSGRNMNDTAMIMTDLSEAYPLAGEDVVALSETQTLAAIKWLAEFHGFWWTCMEDLRQTELLVRPPLEHFELHKGTDLNTRGGVWLSGGYTYLATRRREYGIFRVGAHSEWSAALCESFEKGASSIAELVAEYLTPHTRATDREESSSAPTSSQHYQTLLHGDIKSENLFTTTDEESVAFYDFQYVGLGLGACDLAKLFTCSVPMYMIIEDLKNVNSQTSLSMQPLEKKLLQLYLSQVCKISGKQYEWNTFVRHWETALVDWLRFQASWGFWGNSDWLESRVRSILSDEGWLSWLRQSLTSAGDD